MIVYVKEFGNEFRTTVQQGVQYFTIAEGDRDHCEFIKHMFEVALSRHDTDHARNILEGSL